MVWFICCGSLLSKPLLTVFTWIVYSSPGDISVTSASVFCTAGSRTQVFSDSVLYLMAYSDTNEPMGATHLTITEFVVVFSIVIFRGGFGTEKKVY